MAKNPHPKPTALANSEGGGEQAVLLSDSANDVALAVGLAHTPSVSVVETPEFKAWFGESKVRESAVSSKQRLEDLKPMVVHHGTSETFDTFQVGRDTVNDWGWIGLLETKRHGVFFSESPDFAATFGDTVMPCYLSIQNPFYMDGQSLSDFYGETAEAWDKARGTDQEEQAKALFHTAKWLYNVKDYWEVFDGEVGAEFVKWLGEQGYDGVFLHEEGHGLGPDADEQNSWVVLAPAQIKSASGNCGAFDPANPSIYA